MQMARSSTDPKNVKWLKYADRATMSRTVAIRQFDFCVFSALFRIFLISQMKRHPNGAGQQQHKPDENQHRVRYDVPATNFFDSVVFQFFSKFHRITSCHYSTELHFFLYQLSGNYWLHLKI